MDWNLFNYRQQLERDEPKTDLFSDRLFSEIKRERKRVSPPYELRKQIAQISKKPLGQILKETKGWSYEQLDGCIEDARHNAKKYNNDGGARCNNIIKEINKKLSTN